MYTVEIKEYSTKEADNRFETLEQALAFAALQFEHDSGWPGRILDGNNQVVLEGQDLLTAIQENIQMDGTESQQQ